MDAGARRRACCHSARATPISPRASASRAAASSLQDDGQPSRAPENYADANNAPCAAEEVNAYMDDWDPETIHLGLDDFPGRRRHQPPPTAQRPASDAAPGPGAKPGVETRRAERCQDEVMNSCVAARPTRAPRSPDRTRSCSTVGRASIPSEQRRHKPSLTRRTHQTEELLPLRADLRYRSTELVPAARPATRFNCTFAQKRRSAGRVHGHRRDGAQRRSPPLQC